MRCHVCENDEPIPFRCRYCGRDYCSEHRLPPNHDCPLIEQYEARPAKDREYLERIQGRAGSPQERIHSTLRNALTLRFSKAEVGHLVIATSLVTAVGLSMVQYRLSLEFLAIFVSAFIIHEFGHKFLAQIYHTWAEFRITLASAAITAFSALPFMPLKFIAPGAVFIGPLSRGKHGRVACIGPLTNLAMGTGFLAAHYLSSVLQIDGSSQILGMGAWFNAWIAIFNLIPFFGLDGGKILEWNKLAWVLTMAAAISLYIAGEMMTGGRLLGFLGGFS